MKKQIKKIGGTAMERQRTIKGIAKQNTAMKKFMSLVVGAFISSIGSGLTDFGLAIYILKLTGSVGARLKSVRTLEVKEVNNETFTESCPKGL